jgi:hypothetical protein
MYVCVCVCVCGVWCVVFLRSTFSVLRILMIISKEVQVIWGIGGRSRHFYLLEARAGCHVEFFSWALDSW